MASVRHLGLFPWCVNQETSYFKGDDLRTKAVPIWWRVKKWLLSVEAEYLVYTQTVSFSDTDIFDVSELPILSFVPEKTFGTEADLVCANVLQSNEPFPVFNVETNLIEMVTSVRLPADHVFGTDAGPMVDSFVKIGPHFECFFYADEGFTITTQAVAPAVGSINVSAQATNFTAPLYSGDDVQYFNAALTATEFWPYDPGDGGGPVYDSATGAPLRAFPA